MVLNNIHSLQRSVTRYVFFLRCVDIMRCVWHFVDVGSNLTSKQRWNRRETEALNGNISEDLWDNLSLSPEAHPSQTQKTSSGCFCPWWCQHVQELLRWWGIILIPKKCQTKLQTKDFRPTLNRMEHKDDILNVPKWFVNIWLLWIWCQQHVSDWLELGKLWKQLLVSWSGLKGASSKGSVVHNQEFGSPQFKNNSQLQQV